MQKNAAILLVVVLIVVVVAIVAILLLMPKGGAPAAPGAGPGTSGQPGAPSTPGIVPGVASPTYNGVSCTMSGSVTSSGIPVTYSGSIKAEKPNKMSAVITMSASSEGVNVDMTVRMISDGSYTYAQSPQYGTKWLKTPVSSSSQITDEDFEMSPEEIAEKIKSSMAASMQSDELPQITCAYVADIPDSEFQLPAGAQVMTDEELQQIMLAAYGGGGGGYPTY
jgi:hypothetical protein